MHIQTLRRSLLGWYDNRAAAHPWRFEWQKRRDPYVVWVSEIMLQQTVIKAVTPVFIRFLKAFPTVHALAEASEESLRSSVRGLGYYRRFANMHRAAKHLASASPVQWPSSYGEWLDLPGIGAYTAAAISSITLGQAKGVVDGNVERVLCRLFDRQEPTGSANQKREFQTVMDEWVDPLRPGDFNQAVMELGQTLCAKRDPSCETCPIQGFCLAFARQTTDLAPSVKPRQERIEVSLQLLVCQRGRRVLLVERPKTARFLKGHLGFPTVINQFGHKRIDVWDGYDESPADAISQAENVGRVRHAITRHKISATVLTKRSPVYPPESKTTWVDRDEVDQKLVSNLDRKAWNLFTSRLKR